MKLPHNKMLKYGNKEFRNLEEQVRQNKDDIARHYAQDRVLADFGIKVVGQVDAPADLPPEDSYAGEYGDAYAVGTEAPFTFYIWTRANSTHPEDYWFDFGEITIVGPQGPKGDTVVGPMGKRGSLWYTGATTTSVTGAQDGDMFLATNGNVYRYLAGSWNLITNIMGKTGAQGLKGDDAGTIQVASIRGVVPNIDVLSSIDPTTVPVGTAYLVGSAIPYNVYLPINGMWQNIGQFNAGTIVEEDGTYASFIDMSEYLKITGLADSEYGFMVVPEIDEVGDVYARQVAESNPDSDQEYMLALTGQHGALYSPGYQAIYDAASENSSVYISQEFAANFYQPKMTYRTMYIEIYTRSQQEIRLCLSGIGPARTDGTDGDSEQIQYQGAVVDFFNDNVREALGLSYNSWSQGSVFLPANGIIDRGTHVWQIELEFMQDYRVGTIYLYTDNVGGSQYRVAITDQEDAQISGVISNFEYFYEF